MDLPHQVTAAEKQVEDMMAKLTPQEPAPVEENQPAAAEPQAPPAQHETEDTAEDLKKKLADTQHQLSILQGKYRAEIEPIKDDVTFIQRAKGEMKQLRNQVSELVKVNTENTNLITELRQQLESKPEPAPVEPPTDPTKMLSEEELAHLQREDLSGETLNIIWKLVNEATKASRGQDYTQQFKELDQRVAQVDRKVTENATHTWQQQLQESIPNYSRYFEDTADPAFVNWLDSPLSPFSRGTNRQELQEALGAHDLQRVVDGIKLFESMTQTPQQHQPPANPLESQLEPSENIHGDNRQAGSQEKRYRLKDIEKFHVDQTRGIWRGREKEAAALNQEYIRAAQQGRIDP